MVIACVGADRLVGGRYVLEVPIGRGGMGEVWRARHVTLSSPVAIKFLGAACAESETSRRRFLTEAQVTAALKTRYAVQVFDFGVTEDGIPYLVMELLDGETLDRRIAREGRLSASTTVAMLSKAARALDRAHGLGIVHRDFKPENVMIVSDEEGGEAVKVVDFGVAKLIGGMDDALKCALASMVRSDAASEQPISSITNTGVGTPYYMAPEQVQGAVHVGPAADIWAFGVVAYECLTGRRPFDGDTVGALLLRVLGASPQRPASSCAPVPVAFDDWFGTACARMPEERFPSVQAAAQALARALAPACEDPVALEELSPRAGSVPSLVPDRMSEATWNSQWAPPGPAQEPSLSSTTLPSRRHPRAGLPAVATVVVLAALAFAFALRWAPSGLHHRAASHGGAPQAASPPPASTVAPFTTPTASASTTLSCAPLEDSPPPTPDEKQRPASLVKPRPAPYRLPALGL